MPEEDSEAELRVCASRRRRGQARERPGEDRRGPLDKWLEEVVLLHQAHVNDDKHGGKTIEELRAELAANTGENVVIRRFARFQVGEE